MKRIVCGIVGLGLALATGTVATSQSAKPWPPGLQPTGESSPVLSPEAELGTFFIAPGYRVELVASEPLVQDPVVIEFDPDGRLWVVEMPTYQTSINPSDAEERRPLSRVVVLEDTNGDGKMDKRTVFKDGLVLARAMKVLDSGVLVGEPPNVWLFKDTDGDLKADTKELVSESYGRLENSIEHNANALFWGMDNWMHVSEYETGLRLKSGKFETRRSLSRGQWGATQDDAGRIYRNSNSSMLHVDVVPTPYYQRHPGLLRTRGSYESLGGEKGEVNAVWSVRTNKGSNRGYQAGILREDFRLADVTGAASPLVFRGDRLPPDVYGNVFVAEPVGNLVARLRLDTAGAEIKAAKAYERADFLASTDERFRPVFLTDSPDGTLYIADIYRGVVQHKIFITEYLRDHILAHNLVEPIARGRIWRVVHESQAPSPRIAMTKETNAQLVGRLSDPNGWRRDAAQRMLVERRDRSVAPALKRLAETATDYRTRLHALWTLDGMDAIEQSTVGLALAHPHRDVRVAAVRIAERWSGFSSAALRTAFWKTVDDPDPMVRRQFGASMGAFPAADRDPVAATLLARYGNDAITVDATLSGLRGSEADVLQRLLASAAVESPNVTTAVTMLAATIVRGGHDASIQSVLQWVTETNRPMWQRAALLAGAESALLSRALPGVAPVGRGSGATLPPEPCPTCPGGRAGPGGASAFPNAPPAAPVTMARAAGPGPAAGAAPAGGRGAGGGPTTRLRREPALVRFAASDQTELGARATAVLARVVWPGKPGVVTAPPLTAEEEKRFEAGAQIYKNLCQACHQADGRGADKIAPALLGSRLALAAAPAIPARVVIGGKEGPVGLMPPLGAALSDDQIAAVLTYIRHEWGQTASVVGPDAAREARAAGAGRTRPWTNDEIVALLAP